jgi:hypothetical protein
VEWILGESWNGTGKSLLRADCAAAGALAGWLGSRSLDVARSLLFGRLSFLLLGARVAILGVIAHGALFSRRRPGRWRAGGLTFAVNAALVVHRIINTDVDVACAEIGRLLARAGISYARAMNMVQAGLRLG